MKYGSMVFASVACFVLTLVVFATEVYATNCTAACQNSNQCIGTNQTCGPCSTGGAGSCGVSYTYFNGAISVSGGGASTTATTPVNCYFFANCTVGAPAAYTSCGAGCGGWSFSSCSTCTTGPATAAKVNALCSDTGCNEG